MSDAAELAAFLTDARAEVRAMAAEAIAGYSADAESRLKLSGVADLEKDLLSLLDGGSNGEHARKGARSAAMALVNLSQEPSVRVRLLDLDAVAPVARAALAPTSAAAAADDGDGAPSLRALCLMLLANLTQQPAGVTQLLAEPASSGLEGLIKQYLGAPAGADEVEHTPLVLTAALATPDGRARLLGTTTAKGAAAAAALATRLGAGSELHRAAAARALRNLSFAAKPPADAYESRGSDGSSAAKLRARAPAIIVQACARLAADGAAYSASESASFAPALAAAVGARSGAAQEPLPEVRLMLTEALLLLSADGGCREIMRDLGIYPVIRESHLAESEQAVKDANESLVSEFYLKDEVVPEDVAEAAAAGSGGADGLGLAEEEAPRLEELD